MGIWDGRSEFLETDDIDGLDVVFPGGDLVEDIVGGDFIVFDHTSALQFVDVSDDGDLLGGGVPDETLNDNLSFDFLPKSVKVESFLVNFDVKNND